MNLIYIYTYRKANDPLLIRLREFLESIGKTVFAPAEPNAMVPFTQDKWAIFDIKNPNELDFMMNFFLEEAYGNLGRITVVSRVIPKSLVGSVDQVGDLHTLLTYYFFCDSTEVLRSASSM